MSNCFLTSFIFSNTTGSLGMLSQLFSFCKRLPSENPQETSKDSRGAETHPQHLDVDDLVHVLLAVVLVPDEDLSRLVCLGPLEALGQEGLVQTSGFGVSHLLDTLTTTRQRLGMSTATL